MLPAPVPVLPLLSLPLLVPPLPPVPVSHPAKMKIAANRRTAKPAKDARFLVMSLVSISASSFCAGASP
jgi:hypothetical protein